jgi:hypothetical protein
VRFAHAGAGKARREVPGPQISLFARPRHIGWYFELGDLINDKIVVRYIFEVPDEVLDQANVRTVRTEIDSILHRLHTMAVAFTDFAGHFIWHCMKKW